MKAQPNTFIVYTATNRINGKRYIGATRLGVAARRIQHFKDAQRKTRDCPRFYDAIRKYGQDGFEWTVLATLATSEAMYKEEERLIALLKPEYNIASGGLVFTSKEQQKKFAFERAQQCSKPVICLNNGSVYPSAVAAERAFGLGRKVVAPQCKRGGITRAGFAFAFLIGSMSEQERIELLSARKAKKAAAEQARTEKCSRVNSRPVTDLNTGAIYTSARVADKALGLVRGTVEACCRRGRADRRGNCFAFGELFDPERHRLLKATLANRQAVDVGWKKNLSKMRSRFPAQRVRCDTYGITFRSAEAVELEYCVSASSIREVCSGRSDQAFGLKFSYAESRP